MINFMLVLGRTFGKVVSFVGFSMSYCLPSLVFSNVVGGNGKNMIILFLKEYDIAGSSLLDIKEIIKLLTIDLDATIKVYYTHIGWKSDIKTLWGFVHVTPSIMKIVVSGSGSVDVIDRVRVMSGLSELTKSDRAMIESFKVSAQNYTWKELP